MEFESFQNQLQELILFILYFVEVKSLENRSAGRLKIVSNTICVSYP